MLTCVADCYNNDPNESCLLVSHPVQFLFHAGPGLGCVTGFVRGDIRYKCDTSRGLISTCAQQLALWEYFLCHIEKPGLAA
jgi:hypothetical protein